MIKNKWFKLRMTLLFSFMSCKENCEVVNSAVALLVKGYPSPLGISITALIYATGEDKGQPFTLLSFLLIILFLPLLT